MKLINFIIILYFLSFLNFLKAESRDVQLNKLFDELKINNVSISYKIEQKIWEIWSTHPNNQKLTKRLAEG